ncbi:hypothetical protein KL914_000664 [Ogataea haglerorum]|nr:hypothetical protein KL914_000664 [Ogataea haglerorum]KAG7815018.1 hypothetical protein KL924_000104 [Ogataea haglerorum]
MYTGTLDSLPHENDPAVSVDELWRRTYGLAQEYVVENEPAAVLERIHTARSGLQKTALLAAMLDNGVLSEQDEAWRPHGVFECNISLFTSYYTRAPVLPPELPRNCKSRAAICTTHGGRPSQTSQRRRVRRVPCARHIAHEHGPVPGSTQTVPDPVQAAGVQDATGHPEPRRKVHYQPGASRAQEGRQPAEIQRLCEPRVLPADPELPDLPADKFFPDGG